MSWWRDIWRQSIFLCFFIIPIPIGSYTIHNGSSAVVALAVYGVLSFIVPLCYIRSRETRFGRQDKAISVCAYIAAWLLLAGGSCWVPAVQKTWWQMSVFLAVADDCSRYSFYCGYVCVCQCDVSRGLRFFRSVVLPA